METNQLEKRTASLIKIIEDFLTGQANGNHLDFLEYWMRIVQNERISSKKQEVFETTCPLLLDDKCQKNPFLTIEAFFEFDGLAGYKKHITDWYRMALVEETIADKANDFLFLHNQFVKLIQAGYIIASENIVYNPYYEKASGSKTLGQWLISAKEANITEGIYYTGQCEVAMLSTEEVKHPYQFIREFFTIKQIKQLRFGLLEWLHAALSVTSSINLLDKQYLYNQYEAMMKIVEAFYLIIVNPSLSLIKEEDGKVHG